MPDFRVILEAALGYDPSATAPVWTDLSAFLRDTDDDVVAIDRGRHEVLNRHEAGTMVAVLDNRTGDLNPRNTAGDYYPNLKNHVRVRLRAEAPWLPGRAGARGIPVVDFPAVLTGWTAFSGSPSTIDTSTAVPGYLRASSRVLRMSKTAGGTIALQSDAFPVTVGDRMMATLRARSGGTNRQVTVGLAWYNNAAGTGSPASTSTGSAVTEASTWSRAHVAATVPGSAQSARIIWTVTSAGAAEAHYADAIVADEVASALTAPLDETRFDGSADRWRQKWAGRDALCLLEATDRFKDLAAVDLPSSVFEFEMAEEGPRRWYRLGEPPASTVVADVGRETGHISAAGDFRGDRKQGEPLVALDPMRSTQFDGNGYVILPAGAGAPTRNWTLQVLVRMSPVKPEDQVNHERVAWAQGRATRLTFGPDDLYARPQFVVQEVSGNNDWSRITGTQRLDDDRPHLITAVVPNTRAAPLLLYIDGVPDAGEDVGGGYVAGIGGIADVAADAALGAAASGFAGLLAMIQDFAIFSRAFSASDAALWASHVFTPWSGDGSGARVSRLLEWHYGTAAAAAFTDVDPGQSILGPTELGGKLLTYLQDVAEVEGGALYCLRTGEVRFRGRHEKLKAPFTTNQFTLGDSGAELPYLEPEQDEPEDRVRNVIRTTSWSATHEARDQASIDDYGPRTHTINMDMLLRDAEAEDAGRWVLAQRKDPPVLVNPVAIDPALSVELWPVVLRAELEQRCTIRYTPPGGGTRLDVASHIEGIEERIARGSWRLTAWTSPADPAAGDYLVMDDSTDGKMDNAMMAY